MTPTELLWSAITAGVAAYFGSYLGKKGETRALHEDIDKLVQQVSAVTTATKQIEATITNETWRRERKSDLQLKTIESVSFLTGEFFQRYIADNTHKPDIAWYNTFNVASSAVRALFDEETYKNFKTLEKMVAPDLGQPDKGRTFAIYQFGETRDAVIKLLYDKVLN